MRQPKMNNNYTLNAQQLYDDIKKTIGIVANSLHPVIGQDFTLTKIPLNLDDYVKQEQFKQQIADIFSENHNSKDITEKIIQLASEYIELINHAKLYYIGETDTKIINARIELFVFKTIGLDQLKTMPNSHQNKTE